MRTMVTIEVVAAAGDMPFERFNGRRLWGPYAVVWLRHNVNAEYRTIEAFDWHGDNTMCTNM